MPSSKSSGSVSAQLSRKAARSPSTAGPWMRKCVSRHSCSLRASPCHSSAMPTPPVKAIASSTIEHLAVRAVVHGSEPEPAQRSEPPHVHAGRVHVVDQRRGPSGARPTRRAARAPARRPAPAPASRRGELGADLAAPVDEREEVDRVLGAGDRVEHRREDLVAVAQHVDAVALGRGHADDALERSAQSRRRGRSSVVSDSRRVGRGAYERTRRVCGSECSTFSSSLGAGAPARTASSCAATAAPNSTATAESSAHSSSATMPASGP